MLKSRDNLIGIIIDPKNPNPNPEPRKEFEQNKGVYVLLDDISVVPSYYGFYPYVSVPKEDVELINRNTIILKNNCPECNVAGEYINGAYKCPNCWKVW